MYTENQKISLRQVFRLFLFDFLGIGTIVLPGLLAQAVGTYGLVSIGIGGVAGAIYLWYLAWCSRELQMDLRSFLQDHAHFAVAKRMVAGILAVVTLIGAGFVGAVLSDMIQKSLIREENIAVIWILILAVAAYAVHSGLENRARVYEVLFWFALAPLVFMLILAARGMDISNFTIPVDTSAAGVAGAAYPVFLVFGPMLAILFLPGRVAYTEDRKRENCIIRAVAAAYGITLLIVFGAYTLLLGNFGAGSLADMSYPIVTLMSAIRMEGGFFKRLDAFMLSVWFFTLFALLSMQLYYGMRLLQCAGRKEHHRALAVVSQLMVLVLGMLIGTDMLQWSCLDCFFRYIQGPLYLLLPAACVWLKKQEKGGNRNFCLTVIFAFFMAAVCVVQGCAATELEKKSIPLLAAVHATEEDYELLYDPPTENKTLDYNHIKVIVLETSILEQSVLYEKLLAQLAKEETFPRNVYVCAANDAEEILAAGELMAEDLGNYIETLLENLAPDAGALPTIGALIDALANKGETPRMPYLKVEGENILWDGSFGIENAIPVYKILQTGENSR